MRPLQGTCRHAFAVATAGCNNNWGAWGIGSRTQWDVNKTFYLGVESSYQRLITATSNVFGAIDFGNAGGCRPDLPVTGPTVVAGTPGRQQNLGAWTFRFRAHGTSCPDRLITVWNREPRDFPGADLSARKVLVGSRPVVGRDCLASRSSTKASCAGQDIGPTKIWTLSDLIGWPYRPRLTAKFLGGSRRPHWR